MAKPIFEWVEERKLVGRVEATIARGSDTYASSQLDGLKLMVDAGRDLCRLASTSTFTQSSETETMRQARFMLSQVLAQMLWQTHETNTLYAEDPIFSVAFSPCATEPGLATASAHGHFCVWDHLKGAKRSEWSAPTHKPLYELCFSPDGRILAGGSWDGNAYLWDLGGNLLKRFDHNGTPVHFVVFIRHGQEVVTGLHDGRVCVWSVHGEKLNGFQAHDGVVFYIKCSPDGNKLITLSWHDMKIWQFLSTTGATLGCIREIHDDSESSSPVYCADFSPDSTKGAYAYLDGRIGVIELESWRKAELECHRKMVSNISFIENDRHLATVSWDGTIRFCDFVDGKLVVRINMCRIMPALCTARASTSLVISW